MSHTMNYPTRFLIITYAVFSLSCAAFTAAAASADCFKQQGDPYIKRDDSKRPIGDGMLCPESANKSCSSEFLMFWNVTSTLNITTDADAKAEIFAAVGKASGEPFPKSVYGSVGNRSIHIIAPGRIARASFLVSYLCYAGVLEDCAPDVDVSNGTAVEACRPSTLGADSVRKLPIFNGTMEISTTDQESVTTTTTSPTNSPTSSPTTNPVAQETPDSNSWASRLGPGSGLLMAMSMAMGLGGWILI